MPGLSVNRRSEIATRAVQNGMDPTTLAALVGHSSLNMVMRYAHPQEQHKTDAMKRLEQANAAAEIAEYERTQRVHTKPPHLRKPRFQNLP